MSKNSLRKLSKALIFIVLAIHLSGCTTAKKEGPVALAPAASKFKDIPIPRTFKQVPQSAYTFESLIIGIRTGTVKYQGKAELEQVAQFYRDQMPRYRWVLENALEYGNVMLNFGREKETCLINLSGQENLVTIDITVGPKLKQMEKILSN